MSNSTTSSGSTPAQFSASPVKGFGHGITNPDPARREEFEEEIRTAVPVAKKLGVKKICVVAGEETKGYSRDEQTQAVIAALKAGAKIVEPEGITIILEPLNILVDHPRQLVVHSEHAASILKAVGSPNVKMLFDIYHQQISEGNLIGQHPQVSRSDRLLSARRPSRPPRADDRRDQLRVRAADDPRRRLSRPDRHGDEPQGRPDGRVQGDARSRRAGEEAQWSSLNSAALRSWQ